MPTTHTLLEQFRSFYYQNTPENIELSLELFAIFGGTSWNIDTKKSMFELIESKILKNYPYIHSDITQMTHSNKLSHALLSAIALGDRRIFSTFKRIRISREEGEHALGTLYRSGLLETEYSLERPLREEDDNSDKLNFIQPFMRFWFSFISPFYKSIKEGNYGEVKEKFTQREQDFAAFIFEKLSYEVLKNNLQEDRIVEIGAYWDKNVSIDLLAKTRSGKLIAGTCKYSNAKVKKTELTKLKEACALAELEPDMYVIFSKNGFSNELKTLKGDALKLFTVKSFKTLVEDLSEKDFIPCSGKKY